MTTIYKHLTGLCLLWMGMASVSHAIIIDSDTLPTDPTPFRTSTIRWHSSVGSIPGCTAQPVTNRILITADHCINDDFGSKGIGSTGGKYSLDYDNDGFADWTANLTHFSRSGVAFGKSRLNSEESASDIAFLALDRELPYWAQIYTMGAYKAEQNIPGLGFRSTTTVDVVGYGQQGVANSNAKNNWEVGGVGLDRWVGFNNVTNDEVDFGGASVLNITLDDLTPLTICSPGGECTTYFESIGAFGDSGSGLFQKQWHFETNSSGMLTPIEEYVMIGVLSTGSAEDVDPGAGKVQYTEYGDYSTYAGLGKHWISDALWDFEEVLGFDYWQDIVYLASLVYPQSGDSSGSAYPYSGTADFFEIGALPIIDGDPSSSIPLPSTLLLVSLGLAVLQRSRKTAEQSPMSIQTICLSALLVSAPSAHASLIKFDFAGSLNNTISGSTIASGDSFSASFVLDTLAPVSESLSGANRYDSALQNVHFSIDGVIPTPYPGAPTNFLYAYDTNQITLAFNFDGSAAPFNGAGTGNIGRFQVSYLATGLLGSLADLSSLDIDLLQTLPPRNPLVYPFGGDQSPLTLTLASVSPVTIPEPASLALLASALCGFGVSHRYRKTPRT